MQLFVRGGPLRHPRPPRIGTARPGLPLLALGTALAVAFSGTGPARAMADRPTPGSGSLGDRLLPTLGNGGYHVFHYDLSFTYDPAVRRYQARTVISARATKSLSRFDLDFSGNTVGQVTVNGRPARYRQVAQKLVITPPRPLYDRSAFRVVVTYAGSPKPHSGPAPGQVQGFFRTAGGGFFLASEPDAAHSVYPCNDYPTDKATMTFHLTVPHGITAAANGVLTGKGRHGGWVTWNWAERAPIATYLTQIAIGRYVIRTGWGPHGLPLRNVLPPRQAGALTRPLSLTTGEMTWLEHRFGRYPFATYGVLAVDAPIRFLNETQTLIVAPAGWLIHGVPGHPKWLITRYGLTHEMTHQWFGDSVSPARWSDLWLNEGPATYFGFLYAAAHGGTSIARDARQWYAQDKQQRPVDGPPAKPKNAVFLFHGASVDNTGALVLYALQREVGVPTFDRIMRAWLTRYRGVAASTRDFIHTAVQVSHRDLTHFLHAWLYGPTTPPFP